MTQLDLSTSGTPEELFVVHPDAPTDINIDVMGCCIERATGVLNAVICTGEDDSENFSLSKKALLGALWAVEGELETMKALLEHASVTEVAS